MKKIAFVLSTFPTLTETFVAGEIKLLMERFPGSRIYSLRPPFDKFLHEESVKLMKATHYLAPIHSKKTIKANLWWISRRPITYIKTLLYFVFHTISNPLHLMKTLYLFPQAVQLASLVESEEIDQLHSHWAGYPTTAAMVASKLLGIPFSFTSHACDMSMIKTLTREKIRGSDFVVTCTGDALRFLSTFLSEEDLGKINVNYHGSNLAKFNPGLRRAREGNKPVIISCADLHERKGLPILLKALARLKQSNYDFRAFIIGEGPQRNLLERIIKELGLEGIVQMPGAVTQERLIQDYYAIADMFVLPCMVQRLSFFRKNVDLGRFKILECKMSGGEGIQKDGIPNVLVEAMAMKIPVISTSVAGIPELIRHNENGLLAPERDPEKLFLQIRALIDDHDLRDRLAEAGYRTVHERFDRSKNIEELLEIFDRKRRPGRKEQFFIGRSQPQAIPFPADNAALG